MATSTTKFLGWEWSDTLWTTLIGFSLVLLMLALLIYVIKLFGVAFQAKYKQKVRKSKGEAAAAATDESDLPQMISTEEVAAIAMAIRLHVGDMHDQESEVLTIHTIKRAYSPWNSKIHGLTKLPERK